jgi:hypothetical protein
VLNFVSYGSNVLPVIARGVVEFPVDATTPGRNGYVSPHPMVTTMSVESMTSSVQFRGVRVAMPCPWQAAHQITDKTTDKN